MPDLEFDELLGAVFENAAAPQAGAPVDAVAWCLRGGYLELHAHPEVDRMLWLSSYVQTYLGRDVRDLLQVDDLDAFARFVKFVAGRSGSLLNLEELGREAGISGPTAKRWLSVLLASHVAVTLPPFHENLGWFAPVTHDPDRRSAPRLAQRGAPDARPLESLPGRAVARIPQVSETASPRSCG